MTRTLHAPARPVLSYQQAYDAGLPVAAAECDLELTRTRLIDRAPRPLRSAVAGA